MRRLSLIITIFIVIILAAWGIREIAAPLTLAFGQKPSFFLRYGGWLACVAAMLILCFFGKVSMGVQWLIGSLRRLVFLLAALLMVAVEMLLHVTGIPHLEGWWIPLVGSGVFAGILPHLRYWWEKFHHRH
jgi:hypothetical protein